jgi:hypothetical protein
MAYGFCLKLDHWWTRSFHLDPRENLWGIEAAYKGGSEPDYNLVSFLSTQTDFFCISLLEGYDAVDVEGGCDQLRFGGRS